MMIVIIKQPLPCNTTNGLMCHIGNPLKKGISISHNLMGYGGNDSNPVENIMLKNKMCRQTNDSYQSLNPLKQSISISLNLMRYVENDSYTVENIQNKLIKWLNNSMCRQINDRYPAPKSSTRVGCVEHPRLINSPTINWLKNIMCRQAIDSYGLPGNYVGNCAHNTRINWLENKKMRRQ